MNPIAYRIDTSRAWIEATEIFVTKLNSLNRLRRQMQLQTAPREVADAVKPVLDSRSPAEFAEMLLPALFVLLLRRSSGLWQRRPLGRRQ